MSSRASLKLCRNSHSRSIGKASHLVSKRLVSYFSRSRRPRDLGKHVAPKKVEAFYDDLASQPMASPPTTPTTQNDTVAEKARIVFGSRLAGPAERRRELEANSRKIGGVMVPPRPAEPDNCCMSGCVNCVWDQYRDELEEWAAKSAEARAALSTQAHGSKDDVRPRDMAAEIKTQLTSTSMDDDGGGSDALWTSPGPGASTTLQAPKETEELFSDIPVGIREFMRMEKKMREKKRAAAVAA